MTASRKNILFIVNPISGTGKQREVEKTIGKHLKSELFDYSVVYTERPKHATEISKQAIGNYDIVAAVGGDGSVHEIGKALIGSNTSLAIIPTGSGNGLANHLKIPSNMKKAILLLHKGQESTIDTMKINNSYFLGTAGSGFDAHIGWEFAKANKRGFFTYIRLILKEYFKYLEKDYHLVVDGKEHLLKAFLVTFANSNQYGNNAFISPNSVIDDGYVRLIVLKKFHFLYAFEFVYRIFTKSLDKFKFVTELKGKEIQATLPSKRLHLDGEPVEIDKEIKINVLPKSLKVMTP